MIPRARQKTIPRPRIDQLIGSEPGGVLLDAPTGYGKTTALMRWAAAQEEAGREVEWAEGPEMVGNPDVLVVDQMSLGDSQRIVEELDHLRAANESLQVVASTHLLGDPPPGWRTITTKQLRFTGEETTELANLLEADTQQRVSALRGTGGWPLAVRAILEGQDQAEFAQGLCQVSPTGTERVVPFLLANVRNLRPGLVSEPLGVTQEEVVQSLDDLLVTGAVLRDRDPAGIYYTAQPAVRPYMQGSGRVPAETLARIRYEHAIAEAEWHSAESVKTLLELGELGEADAVAARWFNELIEDKDNALAALRVAPLEQFEPYPTLLMLRLILERPHKYIPMATVEKMVESLRRSLESARTDSDDPQFLMRMAMQIAASRMMGAWDEALEISYELLDEITDPKWGAERYGSFVSPIFHAVAALAGILGGDMILSDQAAREGHRIAVAQENRLEQVHNLALAALSSILQGEVVKAGESLDQVDRLGGYAGLTPPEFSWVDLSLARALTAASKTDPSTAVLALEEVVPIMGRMEQWPIAVVAETRTTRQIHGASAAHALLKQRLDEQPADREVSPAWRALLLTGLADYATFSGRYDDAERVLQQLWEDAGLGGSGDSLLALSRARLFLYRKKYTATMKTVADQRGEEATYQVKTELAMIHALAAFGLGRKAQATAEFTALKERLDWEGFGALLSRVPTTLVLEASKDLGLKKVEDKARALPENLRTVQHEELSPAEKEVLVSLAEGRTLEEVSEQLFTSVNTLKAHRRNLYRKLRVSSRPEAITVARRLGILP